MGAKDKAAKAAAKKLRTAAKASKKTTQKEAKQSNKSKSNKSKDGPDADAADDDDDSDADTDLTALLASYSAAQAAHTLITTTRTLPPSPRSSATLLSSPISPHELLLFGGEFFDGQYARFYNDLFVYHIRRDAWSVVKSGNAPLPRSGHAWTRGGEGESSKGVWLFGGEFSSPRQGVFYHYADFWRLKEEGEGGQEGGASNDGGGKAKGKGKTKSKGALREWERIEPNSVRKSSKSSGKASTPSPSARSGHRMTHFKHYVVLFGGFQDTNSSTKYLDDLWLFDTKQGLWHQPVLPAASARPEARSSFSLLEWEGGAVLCGGYSRVKGSGAGGGGGAPTNKKGKKGGGGAGQKQDVLKPVVHTDAWFLRITPPSPPPPNASNTSSSTTTTTSTSQQHFDPLTAPPTVRWERRKRPTNPPLPPRAGATMISHRGRGVCFGGVHDVEADEEGIESEFFNGLDVWNVERNRWFGLGLKRPRVGIGVGGRGERGQYDGRDGIGSGGGRRGGKGRAKEGEDELVARLKALEAKDVSSSTASGSVGSDDSDSADSSDNGDDDGAENSNINGDRPVPKAVQYEYPHPRFRAQLAIQEDVLYIFGGTYEKGDREYTFDEMWAVDLGRLDGCKEIFKREVPEWVGSEGESSDEDEGESDGEGQSEGSGPEGEPDDGVQEEEVNEQLETSVIGDETNGQSKTTSNEEQKARKADSAPDAASHSAPDTDEAEDPLAASQTDSMPERAKDDNRPYPRPFESLREFYARTSIEWRALLLSNKSQDVRDASTKATKKAAFALAEERWWDVREEVVAEEERMEESGIGDIVDVSAGAGKDGKGGTGAGAGAGIGGRRR